jgi:hypothetical protein
MCDNLQLWPKSHIQQPDGCGRDFHAGWLRIDHRPWDIDQPNGGQ